MQYIKAFIWASGAWLPSLYDVEMMNILNKYNMTFQCLFIYLCPENWAHNKAINNANKSNSTSSQDAEGVQKIGMLTEHINQFFWICPLK